ncbi:hypothetical protein P4O66_013804, partial [Electrophorus voltai]
ENSPLLLLHLPLSVCPNGSPVRRRLGSARLACLGCLPTGPQPSRGVASSRQDGSAGGFLGNSSCSVITLWGKRGESKEAAEYPLIRRKHKFLGDAGTFFFSAGEMGYRDLPPQPVTELKLNHRPCCVHASPQFSCGRLSVEAGAEVLSETHPEQPEALEVSLRFLGLLITIQAPYNS